jgi:hypothetical protein
MPLLKPLVLGSSGWMVVLVKLFFITPSLHREINIQFDC